MEFWKTTDRAYCYNCVYFHSGIERGGVPIGFIGVCLCPKNAKYQTEADDFCPRHLWAKWTADPDPEG